jgi:hypothetical protein
LAGAELLGPEAMAGAEFITRLRVAVTAFVAEAAVGIFVAELATASWIVSIGVLTAFSIEALVSDPPIMNIIAEMIKTKDTPKTTQGV